MSHTRIWLTLPMLLALAATGCGGSSSETPPPVEPIEQRLRMNGEEPAVEPAASGETTAPAPSATGEAVPPGPPPAGIAPVAPL